MLSWAPRLPSFTGVSLQNLGKGSSVRQLANEHSVASPTPGELSAAAGSSPLHHQAAHGSCRSAAGGTKGPLCPARLRTPARKGDCMHALPCECLSVHRGDREGLFGLLVDAQAGVGVCLAAANASCLEERVHWHLFVVGVSFS